jgi:hypothetical protein
MLSRNIECTGILNIQKDFFMDNESQNFPTKEFFVTMKWTIAGFLIAAFCMLSLVITTVGFFVIKLIEK